MDFTEHLCCRKVFPCVGYMRVRSHMVVNLKQMCYSPVGENPKNSCWLREQKETTHTVECFNGKVQYV